VTVSTLSRVPYSAELERAVLGAILMDGAVLDAVPLRSEDFHEERNQLIHRASRAIFERGEAVDLRTLQAELESRAWHERTGGLAYLCSLDLDLPDIGRIETYFRMLRELAGKREAIKIAGDLVAAAQSDEPLSGLVASAATRLDELSESRRGGAGFVSARDGVVELGAYLDREGVPVGVRTGIPGVDEKIVAMEPGQMWLVAARPKVGKTALMLQMASRECQNGQRVGIISLEMRRVELMMRLAARASGVPFLRIRTRQLTSAEHSRVTTALQKLQAAPLWIDDEAGQSMREIAARARTLARRESLDVVMVDYLTLIEQAGTYGRQDLEIDAIANGLANLSKDLPASVIAMAQLGKKSEFERRPPILADLKDAGEAPAYGALILHRNPVDDNRSLLTPQGTITIAKNRGGEDGEIPVLFDGPTMTWKEVDYAH
jgi:replicative DNA helicase